MESENQLVEQVVGVASTPQKQGWLRVRYSFGNAQFEGEGAVDEINRHVEAFLAIVGRDKPSATVNTIQQVSSVGENNEPLSANNGSSKEVIPNGENNHLVNSLTSFYLKYGWDAKTGKSAISQADQILLITYYHAKHKHIAQLSMGDYQQAYAELADLPIKVPGNISARLSEIVQNGCLKKAGSAYSLTHKGEQAVEKILVGK